MVSYLWMLPTGSLIPQARVAHFILRPPKPLIARQYDLNKCHAPLVARYVNVAPSVVTVDFYKD